MSVEFITGKPGGGKSLMGMRQIITELRDNTRCISTNVSIDLPRLCEYLHEKYGETYNAMKRIRILNMQECSEFWLYRYRDVDIDPDNRITIKTPRKTVEYGREGAGKQLKVIDYEGQKAISEGGVLFVIDEIHIYFNARNWQQTGDDALYYLSQHRKFGDDVVCITQNTKQVETQFSRLAEFFYYCRNTNKLKLPILGGIFKAPSSLIVSQYDDISAKGAPIMTRVYTVDAKGIASCYRTAAGVGFVGASADTKQTQKGMPWYGLVIVLGLVGLGLTKGVGYVIAKTVGSKTVLPQMPPSVSSVPTNSVSVASHSVTNEVKQSGSFDDERLEKVLEKIKPKPIEVVSDVWITGIVSFPVGGGRKGVTVYLSNDERYNQDDVELQSIGKNSVLISGKVYKWNRGARSMPTDTSNLYANSTQANGMPARSIRIN